MVYDGSLSGKVNFHYFCVNRFYGNVNKVVNTLKQLMADLSDEVEAIDSDMAFTPVQSGSVNQ